MIERTTMELHAFQRVPLAEAGTRWHAGQPIVPIVREWGPFSQHGRALLEHGYSPVPILPGTKRPSVRSWDRLRTEAVTPETAKQWLAACPMLGVGVAGGFNGLVPVDIDTDDAEITAIIAETLPVPTVVKTGRRGFTTFCHDPDGTVGAHKLKAPNGQTLVEVLVTGQTVLPPTIHSETRRPYRWATEATLFDTSVYSLPRVTEGHFQALREALAPFLARPSTWERQMPKPAVAASMGRMEAYARKAVEAQAAWLQTVRPGTGRNVGLFRSACKLGKWVHHGIIPEGDLIGALMSASELNGLVADDGTRQCLATIGKGLEKSAGDGLPSIEDRPRPVRDTRRHRLPLNWQAPL